MNIAYLSALPRTMSGGPKYSVPNQVSAQANYDNVIWINTTPWGVPDSAVECECLNDLNHIIDRILKFNSNLVVFEDFYYLLFYKISLQLNKHGIPYVIVPRGCLTQAAQKQRWIKKMLANWFLFFHFARKAHAIEYLSENEYKASGEKWNKRSIIIPNGTIIPTHHSSPSWGRGRLQGTFIGRINPYHKGLDVFFEVCRQLKSQLVKKNVKLDFYGPYTDTVGEKIFKDIKDKGLDDIIGIHKEIHGELKNQVLLSSDFFILTSRFEGLPMGLLEALAYGLPALVTDETNIGEMIADAKAGFSSVCTVEGVKKSFFKLIELDDFELTNMSKNARELAMKFDWNEIAKKAHDEYSVLRRKER